jgi:hypothetical protein
MAGVAGREGAVMIDVHLMPAGRQLNEDIAIAVFGWKREPNHPTDASKGTMLVPGEGNPMRAWCAEWDEYGRPDWLPDYSGDIALAFDALKALPNEADGTNRWYWKITCRPSCFQIQIWRADGESWNEPCGGPLVDAHSPYLALAICRGVVAAVRATAKGQG